MERILNIGLLKDTPDWQALLGQIGVSYSVIQDSDTITPYDYSMLIVNRPITNNTVEKIKEYLNDGGAIIDTGYVIQKITGGTIHTKKCGYLSTTKLPFDFLPAIIDVYSDTRTYTKAQYLEKTLFIDSFGKGVISFCGFDIDSLLFDTRFRRKAFYSNLPRFPHEEVSYVSKGDITRLLFSFIKHLHLCRGIPFIHKWFFPGNAGNVFLFRIDSDFGNKNQIKQWYDIAEASHVRYTWFLHVSAHKEWLELYKEFKDHEIAVHGYDHSTTNKPELQEQNLHAALNLLKEKGFTCNGYAAPYGLWNNAVHTSCENVGFAYASEFSYAYDSLPLYPVVNKRRSSVMQIPIHPICIGSLLNARADEKGIIEYFTSDFHKNILLLNPIIFYDHVIHDHADVLEEIFKLPQLYSIPSLTFLEFAQWWKHREEVVFSTQVLSNNTVKINYRSQDKKCFVCIWDKAGSYILSDEENPIDLNSSPKTSTTNSMVNMDIERLNKIRNYNWRMHLYSFLNNHFWRHYT
jgi:hypothetical protein